jgi:hypothetical protein
MVAEPPDFKRPLLMILIKMIIPLLFKHEWNNHAQNRRVSAGVTYHLIKPETVLDIMLLKG